MITWLSAFLTPHAAVIAAIADLVTILGVPGAILVFLLEKRKERRIQEYETYDALDDRYTEFQRMCIEYPGLDIHEVAHTHPKVISEDERKQELAAFSILFSIFERAFLMYEDQSTPAKQRQWSGWQEYIRHYLRRESTRTAWKTISTTGGFDTTFSKFFEGLSRELDPHAPREVTVVVEATTQQPSATHAPQRDRR